MIGCSHEGTRESMEVQVCISNSHRCETKRINSHFSKSISCVRVHQHVLKLLCQNFGAI